MFDCPGQLRDGFYPQGGATYLVKGIYQVLVAGYDEFGGLESLLRLPLPPPFGVEPHMTSKYRNIFHSNRSRGHIKEGLQTFPIRENVPIMEPFKDGLSRKLTSKLKHLSEGR